MHSIKRCLIDGCYTFTIKDSAGDGICCSYNFGHYSVQFGSEEFTKNGIFGYEESTPFGCTQAPTSSPQPTLRPTDPQPTHHPTTTHTKWPTPFPTLSPTSSVAPTFTPRQTKSLTSWYDYPGREENGKPTLSIADGMSFNVEARTDVRITSFNLNLNESIIDFPTKDLIDLEIWTKEGSLHQGFNQMWRWTKIADTQVKTLGVGRPTLLPDDLFNVEMQG
eukprot:9979679-Ditylum_brightwellii.AAC.1